MKVFLAGIIQGSLVEAEIHKQDWREPIKAALSRHVPEAQVYCHYTAHPNSIGYELAQIRRTFRQGVDEAIESDILIAFCPSASMGTAIEMYEAYRHGSAVLSVTPLRANWVIRAYSDRVFESVEDLEDFLASGQLPDLLAEARGRVNRG
jgi:hypothetical protein